MLLAYHVLDQNFWCAVHSFSVLINFMKNSTFQDNIQKAQTGNDLSVSNHSFLLPPAFASSFVGSSSLHRRGMNNSVGAPPVNDSLIIEEFTNSVLSKVKSLEEQVETA